MTSNRNFFTEETMVKVYEGYIAVDANCNVIGFAPTTAGSTSVPPYSLFKGVGNALNGVNGVTQVQPHIGPGTYQFNLDRPFLSLLYWNVSLPDGYGNTETSELLFPRLGATNVSGTTGLTQGNFPGTDQTQPAQIITIHFRNHNGTLVDPPANSGWYMRFDLKQET